MTVKNQLTTFSSEKVKVAVRVRPLLSKKENFKNVVKISKNSIILSHPNDVDSTNTKQFGFDFCFPSTQQQEFNPSIASTSSSSSFNSTLSSQQFNTNLLEGTQEHLFKTIGIDVINNAFCGFNTCVLLMDRLVQASHIQ
uniref:Uncharacterized protein n=1 Tax=Meloidogyne enterolobii TaxID=390850 RepID=A0A6V7V9V8_MELEN|nr:unnamed protein product [Meloidogyne enterolobii]